MSGVPFGRAQGQRAAQLMELLGLGEEELYTEMGLPPATRLARTDSATYAMS